MTDKEFRNKVDGAMEKCFNAMTQHEAYSEEFTTALKNLSELKCISHYIVPAPIIEDPAEPYVEEPPYPKAEEPEEEPAIAETVDYKALRTDLQKALSRARAEKGINPKELVSQFAASFKEVADEDLPKLQTALNEALANA